MKRESLSAIVLVFLFLAPAIPAFAQANAPGTAPGANFEQRKARVLKNLDERISRLEQAKACIQAATGFEALRACREKFAPPQGPGGGQRGPGRRGGMTGPGGMGGPGGGPGGPPQGQ